MNIPLGLIVPYLFLFFLIMGFIYPEGTLGMLDRLKEKLKAISSRQEEIIKKDKKQQQNYYRRIKERSKKGQSASFWDYLIFPLKIPALLVIAITLRLSKKLEKLAKKIKSISQ